MHLRHRLLVGVVVFFAIPALAGVSDADLQREYGDKVLTLRQFIPGTHLQFDVHGGSSTVERGPWTLYGQIRVQQISLKQGVVHIAAWRVFLFYDPETKHLRDVASVTQDDPDRKLFGEKLEEWEAKAGKVDIDVQCDNPRPEMPDVVNAMNAVFFPEEGALTDAVPEYWKRWLGITTDIDGQLANAYRGHDPEIHRVGGSVSPPHAKYDPDPKYTDQARHGYYEGTTVLWLVVDRDGLPKYIRITKPVGMGLDDEAVKAVQTWKFDPAMKDGNPVPVMINVEVNFKLY